MGDDRALQRLGAGVLEQVLDDRLAVRHQPFLALRDFRESRPPQSLHHHAHRAVAQFEHANDRAERPDVVELVRERVHHGAFRRLHAAHRFDHAEQHALLALDHFIDELNGFGIGEGQREDDVGIDDELAQREDREALHQVTRTDWTPEARVTGGGGCFVSRISRKPCS